MFSGHMNTAKWLDQITRMCTISLTEALGTADYIYVEDDPPKASHHENIPTQF